MEKQPHESSRLQGPLSVFVEKFGDKRVRVHGDISKETLRELLTSSLKLVPNSTEDGFSSTRDTLVSTRGLDKLDVKSKDKLEAFRQISGIYNRPAKGKSEAGKFHSDGRQTFKTDVKEKLHRQDKRDQRRLHGKKTHTRGKMEFEKDYGEQYPEWTYYDDQILKSGIEEEKEEAGSLTCPSSLTNEVELSFDGKWLRKYMKVPLKMAIKEIVAKKPYDPVGYLGFWLLNYRKCQEYEQRELEEKEELNYQRSMIKDSIPKDGEEECISVNKVDGEEEEEMRDWNFKYYDTAHGKT